MKNVLLLKAGEAANAIRLVAGDYDRWFLQVGAGRGLTFRSVAVHLGEPLPARAGDHDAVVMTGSPLSVIDRAPWMLRAAEFLREAVERGVPVLGVCFGHQLLAEAYGVPVQRSPNGREIGTVEVELSDEGQEDFLFRGLPRRFAVQATHEDVVPELPPGARLLAGNAHSPIQAMAIGPHARGVQFHPEMGPDAMRAVISARAERLEAEAAAKGIPRGERVRGLLAGVGPTPLGRRVLENFLDHVT